MGSDSANEKKFTTEELKARLSRGQFAVTQNSATEPAFTGIYYDEKSEGVYRCIVCDTQLFSSDAKYDSGSGWPSFWEPLQQEKISEILDTSLGRRRMEVACSDCGAHLGHVFEDGPEPTGQRYCINSASLRLEKK